MKKKVVLLTGSELRHKYLAATLSICDDIELVKVICESDDLSLRSRLLKKEGTSRLLAKHILDREVSEKYFFKEQVNEKIYCIPQLKIKKGSINSRENISSILSCDPDLIICYGSSLISEEFISYFPNRFLNVHLGLSPYYRGSGTNIWPMINHELEYVGATFMYIDAGIDTGEIIHQIRPKISLGDGPHQIGNRLIKSMCSTYVDLITNFEGLTREKKIEADGYLYRRSDFNNDAVKRLYDNFASGMVDNYIQRFNEINHPRIIENKGLKNVN
jgi:phosphoribosylglycinamide formyltransferase 1